MLCQFATPRTDSKGKIKTFLVQSLVKIFYQLINSVGRQQIIKLHVTTKALNFKIILCGFEELAGQSTSSVSIQQYFPPFFVLISISCFIKNRYAYKLHRKSEDKILKYLFQISHAPGRGSFISFQSNCLWYRCIGLLKTLRVCIDHFAIQIPINLTVKNHCNRTHIKL